MDVRSGRNWTINGDFLTLRPNGVARYAREVTAALDALIGNKHPLTDRLSLRIVAPRQAADPLRLDFIPLQVLPEFNRPRIPQFWVQAQLPWKVAGGLMSFCNLGPVLVPRQIVCIHDAQTWISPDSYSRGFRLAHHLVLPMLGRWARAITTVSKFSRDRLVDLDVARKDKLVVTYNGHEHALRWNPAISRLAFGERPFVFAIGRKEKHKNHELLQRLAAPLDELGIDLCVAGDIDRRVLAGPDGNVPSNVRLLGHVTDDDLARALDNAICFIFPSRMEGFGLPVVEAMARGCPVVVSDAGSLPEIFGHAALYAPPDQDAVWLQSICRVRDDAQLRRTLVDRGRNRVRLYSWSKIAELYLELMACIDARKPFRTDLEDRIFAEPEHAGAYP